MRPDQFLWALTERLQNPGLALTAEFQVFCLDVHDVLTVEEAAESWGRR